MKPPTSQWLSLALRQEEVCTCQTEELCSLGTQISSPVRNVEGRREGWREARGGGHTLNADDKYDAM